MPKPVRNSRSSSPQSEPETPTSGEAAESLETVAKRHRRVFTAADKLRIVKEADSCLASGKRGALGALLRREGIYSSLLSTWRAQLGAHGTTGLAAKKAGRKPKLTEAERRVIELTKRNAVLGESCMLPTCSSASKKKRTSCWGSTCPGATKTRDGPRRGIGRP